MWDLGWGSGLGVSAGGGGGLHFRMTNEGDRDRLLYPAFFLREGAISGSCWKKTQNQGESSSKSAGNAYFRKPNGLAVSARPHTKRVNNGNGNNTVGRPAAGKNSVSRGLDGGAGRGPGRRPFHQPFRVFFLRGYRSQG